MSELRDWKRTGKSLDDVFEFFKGTQNYMCEFSSYSSLSPITHSSVSFPPLSSSFSPDRPPHLFLTFIFIPFALALVHL